VLVTDLATMQEASGEPLTRGAYGSCPCGGVYQQNVVEVRMNVGDRTVILSDVLQGRCPRCDSRVYKAATLEGIEALMSERPPPPPRTRSS
jgi:hypothetical protein